MGIPTDEENYAYRMKRIVSDLVNQHEELQGLSPDMLHFAIWNRYVKEFGHAVLDDMFKFAGDGLFELYLIPF